MNAMERLEELLDAKDEKISDLEGRLEDLERELNVISGWTRHVEYTDAGKVPNPELPVPRLEVRWQNSLDSGYEVEASYSLVYRHLLGHVVFVPLGVTRRNGSVGSLVNTDGSIDLPFRDGAHLRSDMAQLHLRGFGIYADTVHEYQPCSRCGSLDVAHNGRPFGALCEMTHVDGDEP